MILRLVLIALLLNFLFFNISYAYIDPNTGGFFFQTVAPFVYGILGVIVVFWKRIKALVKGFFSRNNDSENSAKDQ